MEGRGKSLQSVCRKIKGVEFEQEKKARLQLPTLPIKTVSIDAGSSHRRYGLKRNPVRRCEEIHTAQSLSFKCELSCAARSSGLGSQQSDPS